LPSGTIEGAVHSAPNDPTLLRIHLFGRPRFIADGQPFKFRGPAKALNFLAYLLLHRGSHVTRESLAFTLFPDDAEEAARANLRRMLYLTHRALPVAERVRWIEADDETIQWNDAAPAWVDVAAFELLSQTRDGEADAVELYAGELLAGHYDDWLFPFRERCRQTFVSALYSLVHATRRTRDFRRAASYANRLLGDDPFREDVVRQLLSVLYESGDGAGAVSAFEIFRKRLHDELQVEPMPETVAVVEHIRSGGTAARIDDDSPGTGDERRSERGGLTVGRDAEIEQLHEYWSRAARGRGRLVFVAGEAGIGKTRLVTELALAAELEGARVLWGVTTAPETAPFQGLSDALRSALPLVAAADIDPVRLAAIARIVPDLRVHRPDLPELDALDSDADLLRLFDALAALVGALARPRPLLLIVEDGHWAGSAFASALEHIARASTDAAALLVCTFRTEAADAAHPLRAVRRRMQQDRLSGFVAVGRLTEADVRRLVRDRPALAPRAESLAPLLHARSSGNPLFLVEAMRDLDEGIEPSSEAANGVRDLIHARCARLSPDGRALAETCAAVGEAFDVDVLREVSGWDESVLLDCLGELQDRTLIRDGGGRSRYDYVFTHALVRETIYEASDADRVRRIHHRIARVLEAAHSERLGEVAGEIARHYERGGSRDRAAIFFRTAAAAAFDVAALEEALSFARDGLAMADDTRLRLALLQIVDDVRARRGEHAVRGADIDRIITIAQDLGDPASVIDALERRFRFALAADDVNAARAALAPLTAFASDHPEASFGARALLCSAELQAAAGDYAASRGDAHRALDLAESSGDSALQLACVSKIVEAAAQQDSLEELRAILDRFNTMSAGAKPAALVGVTAAAANAAHALMAYRECKALQWKRLNAARSIGDRIGEAAALRGLGAAANELFEIEEAREFYSQSLEIYRALGHRREQAVVAHDQALLDLKTGKLAEAIDEFAALEMTFSSLGYARGEGYAAMNLSAAAAFLGRADIAMAAARRCLAVAEREQLSAIRCSALTNLGVAERLRGDLPKAVDHLEEACRIARTLGLETEVLDVLAELAETKLQIGDRTGALDAAREVVALRHHIDDEFRFPETALFHTAQVLQACGETGIGLELLAAAHDEVERRSASFRDEASRNGYASIPFVAAINAAYAESENALERASLADTKM
jgi:DNA-binding SARP family transcriptional activator/tetratricopeptide (TPR) repeat protein